MSLGCVLSLWLAGCEPPDDVTPAPDADPLPSWQLHPEIRLDRRLQMHAKAAGDTLWPLGNNYLLSLDQHHRLISDELVAPLGNDLWERSFLSKTLFATELDWQYQFDLRLNRNPAVKARVNLRELNPDIFKLNSYYNPPMAINASGQILVGGWINGRTGCPLFVLQHQLAGDSLSVTVDQELWVNRAAFNYAGSNMLNGIYAFGDTFYFSISSPSGFYRLLPGQEPEYLSPQTMVHMFRVRDTLMAIGYLPSASNWNLGWYFQPPGSTIWQGRDLGYFDNGFMRYTAVQDRVIAYRGHQIWELIPNLDLTYVRVRELNSQGLEQLTIHDIVVFQERIYLCTSRGLYFQPLSSFFTYKPTE